MSYYLQVSWPIFVFIWSYTASGFSQYCSAIIGILYFIWWEFFFLFLVSLFCKRCVYVFDFCILNWLLPGPWEFLWRAESCIYFVCVSPLCGVPGRYKFIWAFWWCGRRDCTDFPFSLAMGGGYCTVEMVRGVVRFSFALSVCWQFSWRLDVCGRNFVLYIF